MTDKQPTQEQIKEFRTQYGHGVTWYVAPNGTWLGRYPDIDLNNLSKYAVPKLPEDYDIYLSRHWERPSVYSCAIQNINLKGFRPIFISNEDPALALFWALWQVKEQSK